MHDLPARSGSSDLDQWFTPAWVAELIVERYFPNLDRTDLVCEPSCGTGAILGAIPAHVPAIGVEIDPALASIARRTTGRQIVEGDFATVALDFQPTAIIGNPPFATEEIERFIARAHGLLPENGRMGLILPSYAFQTSRRLARWAETWSLSQEALPRDLFPNLSKPISFVIFSKDNRRSLVGFAFYREAASMKDVKPEWRDVLARAVGKSAWKRCIAEALIQLGGEADLEDIYTLVGARRPTANPWWREQARKALQQSFHHAGPGRWALPLAA